MTLTRYAVSDFDINPQGSFVTTEDLRAQLKLPLEILAEIVTEAQQIQACADDSMTLATIIETKAAALIKALTI